MEGIGSLNDTSRVRFNKSCDKWPMRTSMASLSKWTMKLRKIDPVITAFTMGKSYPIASKDELLDQISSLKKRFVYYKDYASASIHDLFDRATLSKALHYKAYTSQSIYLENAGNGNFKIKALPVAAQFSSINGILSDDFDLDGHKDVLITGNYFLIGYKPVDQMPE